jgi:hypothetical protein
MRKAILFLLAILPTAALAQIAVQFSPADFIGFAPASQQITITPLWNYTASGTNIVHGQARSFSTGTIIATNGKTLPGTPGTLIVSNVFVDTGGSAYHIEIFPNGNGPLRSVGSYTNVFTNGSPAFVNSADMLGVATNATMGNQFAYTRNQTDEAISNALAGIGGGVGEANLGANIGTGAGIFAGKSGVTLQLRDIATSGGATG